MIDARMWICEDPDTHLRPSLSVTTCFASSPMYSADLTLSACFLMCLLYDSSH